MDHLPAHECFYSKLRKCNPIEKEYLDYEKLVQTGLSHESAMQKLRITRPPLTGDQIYAYLVEVWEREKMLTSKVFLHCYSNKDVIPTLEAMQKMIDFYHNKGNKMLKLGCILPNSANICLQKSTRAKVYPFTETDKDLLGKIREVMVGGASIVFTRRAVVDETFIRKPQNVCKSIVGNDASQLYRFSMCQPIPM